MKEFSTTLRKSWIFPFAVLAVLLLNSGSSFAQSISPAKLEALESGLIAEVDKQQKMTQEMVEMIFSNNIHHTKPQKNESKT